MTDVAVIGGGIGGLTAAHELAERGLDVVVFEANERFGGKARSIPLDGGSRPRSIDGGSRPLSVNENSRPLHGEHGFRFFPAFYRHVVDGMERIPDGAGTVADNLVETEATLIASVDGVDRTAKTARPDSPREWLSTVRPAFAEDLPARDVRFLLERLLYLLTACEERRAGELDDVSWWEFVDAEHRSRAFRDRVGFAVQSLVALRPQVGSARTIGTIYLQLLFGRLDPARPTERVLNAPTSEAWIDPWIRHLERLGVDLRPSTPVRELAVDDDPASGSRAPDGRASDGRVSGSRNSDGRISDRGISGVVLEDGETVRADDYVLAVPVHVAPEFVTPELARLAPELRRIERLDTAWMNGVQFYLSRDVALTRGHQVYVDAPWALTSISQRQFWTGCDLDTRGPDEVSGVLSVIASNWDAPGVLYGKPARECTREEIAAEIWAQLKAHLNGDGRVLTGGRTRGDDRDGRVLTDEMLVDWFLDPAIVETDEGVENRSPLLVNTAGSLRNRPPADTSVGNLALAGDYVRTNADLASMESAAEAGRRAANAVLDRRGRAGSRAEIWALEEPPLFEPFKRQDRVRYRLGLPHPAEVTHSIRTVGRGLGGWI